MGKRFFIFISTFVFLSLRTKYFYVIGNRIYVACYVRKLNLIATDIMSYIKMFNISMFRINMLIFNMFIIMYSVNMFSINMD